MFTTIQNAVTKVSKTSRVLMTGVLIAATLGGTGVAMAHGPKHDRAAWEQMSEAEKQTALTARLDKKMERLTQKLELTPAQVPKVRAILESAQQQRHAIKEQNKGDRKAARPAMKALKEQTKTQLAGVLTAEQAQTMQQLHEQKKARKGKRGKHGEHGKRGEKRMEHMAAELELSAEQQVQVGEVFASAKLEREQIIELVGSKKEAKPELKALRARTQADVRALLSQDQVLKLDAMEAKRKQRRGERKGKRDK